MNFWNKCDNCEGNKILLYIYIYYYFFDILIEFRKYSHFSHLSFFNFFTFTLLVNFVILIFFHRFYSKFDTNFFTLKYLCRHQL